MQRTEQFKSLDARQLLAVVWAFRGTKLGAPWALIDIRFWPGAQRFDLVAGAPPARAPEKFSSKSP